MFLSREIDIKLCQNYTKSYIYQISYKIRSIKQTIFNKYATNLKTTISYRSLAEVLVVIFSIWYNFDTVLYQFLETGTSDVLYVSFKT